MNYQPEITLIKGDGSFPPPRTRRIFPDKNLLWKYYFKTFLVWVIILGATFLSMIIVGLIISNKRGSSPFTPEIQLLILMIFIVGTVIIGPIVLFLIALYIRSMEFIVHGDEIIVKKGIINKTIKYCPFRTITNISTQVGVFDRLFEIGCINIQTAGLSGPTGAPEEKLEGLRVYSEIREYILSQLRQVSAPSEYQSGQFPDESKDMVYNAILHELRGIKREFKRKKGVE